MATEVWYHGANGDNILGILRDRKMQPKNGQIFFSAAGFAGCFPMGADTKRRACFVIKVRLQIPAEATVEQRSTNVSGTKVVMTAKPGAVEVLELYVRPKPGSPIATIKGADSIRKYLAAPPPK